MTPGKHDFTCYAGATFLETVEWQNPDGTLIDLNDYRGRMQVRTDEGQLITELDTLGGQITPQEDKRARLFIDDNITRDFAEGNYRYDLLFEHTTSDVVTPLLRGRFKIIELVTRMEP